MLYESHITCSTAQSEIAQVVADAHRWKTSQISRDITLGDATYFYLTTHDVTEVRIMQRLRETVDALEIAGVNVIRQKIELIIFDTKHNVKPVIGSSHSTP
jgi:hypothetical protein